MNSAGLHVTEKFVHDLESNDFKNSNFGPRATRLKGGAVFRPAFECEGKKKARSGPPGLAWSGKYKIRLNKTLLYIVRRTLSTLNTTVCDAIQSTVNKALHCEVDLILYMCFK